MVQNQIAYHRRGGEWRVSFATPLKKTSSNNILFARENRSDKNTNKQAIRRKEKRLQTATLETRKT